MDHKEEIRRRIDVADLIGDSLELKPAGGGSMKAICPFHTEKTPSFYVSKEKQIWHCFGCGKGGDIFAFVMEMEGADFSEALRVLGKRAGVEIPRFSSTASNEKTRLLESNKQAESVFKHVLRSSDHGQHARSYVASRGYTDEIVDAFGIGFAPNEWSLLCDTLKKKGWKDHELVAAGLALNKKKGGGVVDRFRGRLMIPLRDHHGNTVGFTGRVLPGSDDSGPKYMNSPETLVYKKGELLFGLDRAKVAIKKEKQVVIVEGNLDVLASHMVGVEHVVASSGTALTQAQLHLLKRFTDTVVFCFDQDTAGFRAARKGIHLATELGFRVRVIQIPPGKGKDPDELIKQDAEAWKRLARHPIDIMEYYFQVAEAKNDLTDVQRKKRVGAFLLEEIARLPDVIEQEHWLRKLSPLVQVDVERLRGSLSKHNDGETPTA
ncbi:MAG: DNA primase, partial [Candidatus Magasanikbacteria bacterium RIFCSPLOWO2_02_FULL_44_11]